MLAQARLLGEEEALRCPGAVVQSIMLLLSSGISALQPLWGQLQTLAIGKCTHVAGMMLAPLTQARLCHSIVLLHTET